MKTRILYVITDSGTGGSENVLTQVYKNIDREKYEPCGIVVLKNKREMAFHCVDYRTVDDSPPGEFSNQ